MIKKKDKPTRVITPYKGGRSASLTVGLTPDEKQAIQDGAKGAEMSIPDFIMMCVDYYNDNHTP